MKILTSFFSLLALFLIFSGFTLPLPVAQPIDHTPAFDWGLSERNCTSSFNGDVHTYTLNHGYSNVGHSVWISRKSQRAKAKYFAHKLNGEHVHHRYTMWRVARDRDVILKSSGAYATSFSNSGLPVGLTIDNGVLVNRKLDSRMNALVIVYATGGIVVSNIKNGDLYLQSLGGKVDVKNTYDREKFIRWAEEKEATVFQLHLMAYDNSINVGRTNSSNRTARRKLFSLAKSSSGELFHIIHYLKKPSYSLYEATDLVLSYLRGKGMDVIATVNLDTGGYDILNTAGAATDCNGNNVWGTTKNYDAMTNLLTYEYD
ncbi:MAG: hypothetical protein AAGD05_17480 [Bacteroidota bacterium]